MVAIVIGVVVGGIGFGLLSFYITRAVWRNRMSNALAQQREYQRQSAEKRHEIEKQIQSRQQKVAQASTQEEAIDIIHKELQERYAKRNK